jgi:hypothetical protein
MAHDASVIVVLDENKKNFGDCAGFWRFALA